MSYDYNLSIIDIWDRFKRPFVAINRYGWLVMIKTNPTIQAFKYGKVYGKIDKNLDRLYLKSATQPIDKVAIKCWSLYEIIQDD